MSSSQKVIFGSFVCSVLEYGALAVIWCPTTMSDSYQLERVQRKVLKCPSFKLSIDCLSHDYNNTVLCHRVLLADRRVETKPKIFVNSNQLLPIKQA